MSLEMATERGAGTASTAVVALTGEIDASNFAELIDAGQRLHAEGVAELVLDLSGLTFLASSGLVALYSLLRIMRDETPPNPDEGWGALHAIGLDASEAARHLRLCCAQPGVDRVLERTGLKRLFTVYPDRATAISAA